MSNVGKSLICAALCRIFTQDGYRVAPFKSQNMALNSFVTRDGLEMSRAQVLQAQAAGVEPDVRMNPILLKPTGDMGSQVIVNGSAIGNYSASDYFKMKKSLVPKILEAYDGLAAENDIIVIEGAGSPAEINLRQDDIVNMGLAELVDAPVILVGDIDPGGVFAQLYGTVELLSPEERARIKGIVINKFRGDIELLRPGLTQLEKLCKVPVFGVVPYMDVRLDDEDSLSMELRRSDKKDIDVAVIRLPHISNYTDITPLTLHPSIGVRYVDRVEDMGAPDMVILPGTKNTMGDLEWLKDFGFYDAILGLHEQGVFILGICGGYQMLGESIDDPENVEVGGAVDGLQLLPVRTVFDQKKITRQCEMTGMGDFSNVHIRGYQIHNGMTDIRGGEKLFDQDGVICDGVAGTYMHGLFDTGELTSALSDMIKKRRGEAPINYIPQDYGRYREKQLDILSDKVRDSLDIASIYEMM